MEWTYDQRLALLREKKLVHPRPYLVCFDNCADVRLENVKLTRSPCWTVHPLRCENMVIRGLRIKNPADSPNTDGIDPDGCRNVRISDCTIDVGDDCNVDDFFVFAHLFNLLLKFYSKSWRVLYCLLLFL